MIRTVRDVVQKLSPEPGLSAWDYGVRRYACDLIRTWADCDNGCIWDEISKIRGDGVLKLTEKDLLLGAEDWKQYSDSCSLIYNEDICRRLCNKAVRKRTGNENFPPDDRENWLDLQAKALQEAAGLVLDTVNNS